MLSTAGTAVAAALRRRMPPTVRHATQVAARAMSSAAEGRRGVTYAHQSSLPKLPVPPLDHTLQVYLDTVRPLVDDSAFAATEAAVKEFAAGAGPTLHDRLLKHAATQDNWLEKWWDDIYLALRDPVEINVNYAFALRDEGDGGGAANPSVQGSTPQTGRAARLVAGVLDFKARLDREELAPDATRAGPLCMNQSARLFNHNRRPAHGIDLLHNYGSKPAGLEIPHYATKYFDANPRHIAVIDPRGAVHALEVVNESGARLSVSALDRAFQDVVAASKNSPPDQTLVSCLTATDRDTWATNLNGLLQSASNAASYEALASSMFVVVLDDHVVDGDPTALSRSILHGDGRARWFDKHELIVSSDGCAGWNFEHAPGDGTTSLRLCQESFVFSTGVALEEAATAAGDSAPAAQLLPFELTSEMRPAADEAQAKFEAFRNSLQLRFLKFDHFGKNRIKEMGVSPDGFAQMAMQLAYYLRRGHLVATYESCAMRNFLHGRTETIRSASPSCQAFVEAFTSTSASVQEKQDKFRAAAKAHIDYAHMCTSGEGIDRHLLGLKLVLQEGEDMPTIYSDPSFGLSGTWRMSTSNCTSPALQSFGFGPVCADGIGIGYTVDPEGMGFTITSWDEAASAGEAPSADGYAESVSFAMVLIEQVMLGDK